jgi:hypothetical protein
MNCLSRQHDSTIQLLFRMGGCRTWDEADNNVPIRNNLVTRNSLGDRFSLFEIEKLF